MPDGSKYVQTVPDGKYLCPDRPRRKLPMSRLSCVHQTFVRSCPDFRAFTKLSCVHVQTFVRSPDFRAFNQFLCVHVQTFVRSPDFRAFNQFLCVHVQTFVRSPDFRAFNQFSCVHVQTFVRSPNFRSFNQFSCVHVQTFERSTDLVRSCPEFRAFNRPRAFMSRLSCVHLQVYLLSPGFSAFISTFLSLRQSFVRLYSYFCPFNGFSFVHRVFVLSCPDFCALIKLGCDSPIFVPSSSDKKYLFKSNTIGMAFL